MTAVRIPRHTRDHLAAIAEERGMTLGQIVEAMAKEHPTRARLEEQAAAARRIVERIVTPCVSGRDYCSWAPVSQVLPPVIAR